MNQDKSIPVSEEFEEDEDLSPLANFLYHYGGYMAFVPALVAMLGSLYFSEIAGFVPCTLCWYQRILMYPLSVIILVGVIKRDEYLPIYVLPFSILGLCVALYHYLLQWQVFGHSSACATGVPCSIRYINWGGVVTIPSLSLTAFTMITIIMAGVLWVYGQVEDEEDEY